MLKKIAIGAAGVLALLAAIIAVQPSDFVVERSTVIDAPARVVQPHIENLRAMDVWSPWTKLDAQLQVLYEGPASGVGARSAWEGPEMGKGRLTVTGVQPDREVEMRLEMLEPMAATNRVLFTLAPADPGTQVTWRMEGTNGFAGKLFSLLMDMDQMIGGEFDKGLGALKAIAEREVAKQASR